MNTALKAEDMYKEEILDHYKNPRNCGELKTSDVSHKEYNPLCGDELRMSVRIEEGKVKEIKFEGNGCAISQASASMLTEKAKDMSLEEIKKLTKEDIFEMLAIPIGPVRTKCALLSLDTLKNSIKIYENYGDKK